MKQLIAQMICIITLLAAGNAGAYIEEIEQGYEVAALQVTMTGPGSGTAIVKACDSCEEMALEITADTKLFKGNRAVPLAQIERFRGQEGVVFRDIKSQRVTRIKLY